MQKINPNSVIREVSRKTGTYLETLNRPYTPADYLYQDCVDDTIPDDPEVLEKFGFQSLVSSEDRSKLLGLYQGLVKYLGVTAEELNGWEQENSLATNIVRVYNAESAYGGSGYFRWFLENTHILKAERDPSDLNHYMHFIEQAQKLLEPDDQKKDWRDLQPLAKRYSFEILWLSLLGARPNPILETWLKFGFCACMNEEEEIKLGAIYVSLFTDNRNGTLVPQNLRSNPCTFMEFWQAYESGGLVQLMEDKIRNRGADIRKLPLVREYLSNPPRDIDLSVWNLRQFLEINQYSTHPPIESVKVDYGFLNCQNFEEICTLAELYKRLFSVASPLEVHEACLKNRLFELAKRKYHSMDEDYRRLMNNSYSEQVMLESSVSTILEEYIRYGLTSCSLAQKKFFVKDGNNQREVPFAEARKLLGI